MRWLLLYGLLHFICIWVQCAYKDGIPFKLKTRLKLG